MCWGDPLGQAAESGKLTELTPPRGEGLFAQCIHTWEWLFGNKVQYINRLTASEIVKILTDAGLVIDKVKTDVTGDTEPCQVHPDYRNQSDDDIWAVRLLVEAHKPGQNRNDFGGRIYVGCVAVHTINRIAS